MSNDKDNTSEVAPAELKITEGVFNFQTNLVKKLQADLTQALQAQEDITRGSRNYWQRVHAIHQLVLRIIETRSLQELCECLQNEAGHKLGLDAVEIFISAKAGGQICMPIMPPIPQALAAFQSKESTLLQDMAVLDSVFAKNGGALVTGIVLPMQNDDFHGVLVMGSRDKERFESGMAFEPYVFLAKLVEGLVGGWLKSS